VCPTSNRFLFSRTLSRELLASVERVALGSDSSITAAGDLLDEVRCLDRNLGLDANAIYRMVTSDPAKILRLTNGEGKIVESGVADLVVVRSRSGTPACILSRITYADVELVLLAGRVQLASPDLYTRLPQYLRAGLSLLEVAGLQRWVRSPLQSLFQAAEDVLGEGTLSLDRRRLRHLSAL
jgi:hypothetical protein